MAGNNIYVQGSYIDVHDNENVYLSVDKAAVNVSDKAQKTGKEFSSEQLASAIENCQEYFWGKSAYAVVFCICRDDYKMNMGKTAFEEMVEELPYKRERDFNCPKGTIANAFSDNQIFSENIREWDQYNPLPRIIKLRDELLSELKL